MSIYTDKANKYIDDVLSGRKNVCQFVRLACQRQRDDLKRKDFKFYFDDAAASRICYFAELMPHVKGDWVGSNIVLEPWQCFILTTIFGWLHKPTGLKTDNTRRFRTAYVEVPRKNGKTILAAIIALYMLLFDGEKGAEVYNCATTLDQALFLFEPAKHMVEKTPFLMEKYGVEPFKRSIFCNQTLSKFQPVVGNADGGNVHCGIIDEYHQHDDNTVLRTFREGQASRKQPLNFIITTAGTNLASPCKDMHDHIIQVLEGVVPNDSEFGIVYTIDKDDNWCCKESFIKANPNYEVSVYDSYIEEQLTTAIQHPNEQNSIRTKNLDEWMSVDQAFFDVLKLEKCRNSNIKPENLVDKPCVIGVDLSSKIDLAAVVLLFWDETNYWSFEKFYEPRATILKPENDHLRGWADSNLIEINEGPMLDFNKIQADVMELCGKYNPKGVCFDPWNAVQFANNLEAEGIVTIETRMTVGNMSEPMKELEAKIATNEFVFDSNPCMMWNFSNVIAHIDKKDNLFPNKPRYSAKIDGVVALLMCFNYAIRNKVMESEGGVFFL